MPTKREARPTPFSIATTRAIKALIDDLGVSNAAVARKTGMSPNYLNERLREEKSFTLSDIERLGDYFKFDPADFMCSVEVPSNVTPFASRPSVSTASEDSSKQPRAASDDDSPVQEDPAP